MVEFNPDLSHIPSDLDLTPIRQIIGSLYKELKQTETFDRLTTELDAIKNLFNEPNASVRKRIGQPLKSLKVWFAKLHKELECAKEENKTAVQKKASKTAAELYAFFPPKCHQ